MTVIARPVVLGCHVGAGMTMTRLQSLAVALAAFALSAVPSGAADMGVPTQAHPALWLIVNGSSRLYILGALHILPDSLTWVDSDIANAMEAANGFVLEAPFEGAALAEQKDFIVHHGLLPRGSALHQMLPPPDFAFYSAILRGAGLNPLLFDHYRPWLASLVVGLIYVYRHDITDLHGVDDAIVRYAQSHDKQIAYLETMDEQMALLDQGDTASQAKDLRTVINALPRERADEQQLIAAWASGDSRRFAAIIDTYFKGHEAARTRLVGMRNDGWLPRIDGYLRSGKTIFLAVGAAHLGGRAGLLRQLCDQGYTVERVSEEARAASLACAPKA
jgi:uncharacterized protein